MFLGSILGFLLTLLVADDPFRGRFSKFESVDDDDDDSSKDKLKFESESSSRVFFLFMADFLLEIGESGQSLTLVVLLRWLRRSPSSESPAEDLESILTG